MDSGLASNPLNYIEDEELDTSYEGLLRLSEIIGNHKPKGLKVTEISNLSSYTYTETTLAGKERYEQEGLLVGPRWVGNTYTLVRCSICLEDLVAEDKMRRLWCNHYYHMACLDQWLTHNKFCPICRKDVLQEDQVG